MRTPRAIAAVVSILAAANSLAAEIDFNREIRPILSNNCFKCHGPDDNLREAGLRLDKSAAATAELDSGSTAIVPGKPDESELIARINTEDEDLLMPPASSNKHLTAAQKQLLADWISSGAKYAEHWAFVKPVRPEVPDLKSQIPNSKSQTSGKFHVRNPIDAFVADRLRQEGLSMSPEADGHTLIRRVYLDLIGIPPTPAEADAFVADTSPDAYEKVVDRLFASPHYGERWARRWLDLARYSDTNGYEKDRPRSMWPYRDWVIGALNDGMPFDQFTIKQIAGDMLPDATLADRIATGFHRNTMLNEEGGIDPQEFRFYSNVDRVGTTATVWLGLTMACAQCHTHKYDPLTHTEFYQTLAFFDEADELMLDVPTPELAARRAELDQQIAAAEQALVEKIPDRAKFDSWVEQESAKAVAWTVLEPARLESNLPLLDKLPDQSILASGDQTKLDVYKVAFANPLPAITAIRLEALPDPSLPDGGPGRVHYEGQRGDFFLSDFTLAAVDRAAKFVGAVQSTGDAKGAFDDKTDTGWSIGGGKGQPQIAIFTLAEPLADASELHVQLTFEKYYAAALGRFRLSATADPRAATASHPVEIEAILSKPSAERTAAERGQLLRRYSQVAPELAADRTKIDALRKQLPVYPTTLVMHERPAGKLRHTHRYHRGEYLQPKEQVRQDTPEVLPSMPADALRNRLSFARWLVDRNNPLVARVTMNRHWSAFFGQGLARTQEDFGTQGEMPTHPELLDWLAVEFMEGGWSIKAMHKLIVTSGTYRQASRVTLALAERDPQNRLYARGPRVRLEAELIRDSYLAAAGLLSRKLGGPSVFPPQLPSITTEGAYGELKWNVSAGEDRYRRSLYTFSKRTAPFAMYRTFDAPSGEACVPRRDQSNTPLQALTLLNDAMLVEAAQALASSTSGSDDLRITEIFRRCLTRPPQPSEVAAMTEFIRNQRSRFPNNEQLVWTSLARSILNLDEMIVKQ
jgi:hypothetical protein